MNEEISKLIDLQAIDSEIDGFDQEIYSKEQEVTARQQSITDKEEEMSQCKENTEQLELKQRDTKAELEDAQFSIKDRQNKMMQVQTSREHQAPARFKHTERFPDDSVVAAHHAAGVGVPRLESARHAFGSVREGCRLSRI